MNTDMSGALCVGKPELFESNDWADHSKAKALCDACPVIDECATLLREVWTEGRNGGQPTGTWAGRLIGQPTGRYAKACEDCGERFERAHARGLCRRCYHLHTSAGDLTDFPRVPGRGDSYSKREDVA